MRCQEGLASWMEPACIWTPASAIAAFLEVWRHSKSHYKSLLLTVASSSSGHPGLQGTPLNFQMVLFPQRLPLCLPRFFPDPLAISIGHLRVFILKGNRPPKGKRK